MSKEITEYEGTIIFTNPSTLHMDGTTPISIRISSPGTDILRDMMWRKVKITILDEYNRPV